MIDKLNSWHKTTTGYAVFALLELGMSYVFASFTIDKGNLWDVLFTVLFLVGAIQNFVQLIKKLQHAPTRK
jgi:hypothetical protein